MSDEGELLLDDDEEIAVELVEPDDYVRHRNQVACLTDRRIVFLAKRTLGAYYAMESIPLSECQDLCYQRKLAVGSSLAGVFLTALGAAVLWCTVTGQLTSLQAIIAGLPLLGVGGVLALGIRRHRLVFRCGGRTVSWTSGARHFAATLALVREVEALAADLGIGTIGFPR